MIRQAWQCLFFEMMEAVSPSLVTIALVTYAAKLSSTRTDTTVQGLIGGLHHGLGKPKLNVPFGRREESWT